MPSGQLGTIYAVFCGMEARISGEVGNVYLAAETITVFVVPSALDSSHQPNGYSSSSLHTAVNFDWALCGVPNGGSLTECVFVADSLDDTNEGFDVRTPKEYSSLSVYLIAPKTNWSCTDMGGNTTTAEPFAYFVVTQ